MTRRRVDKHDWLRAGITAAIVSGLPSTAHAVATGRNPFEATAAAGSLVLRGNQSKRALLVAAIPVHVAISLAWSYALSLGLPRRGRVLSGAVYGACIGLFDLRVIGPSLPRIKALPLGPQIADHALFGAVVGSLTHPPRDR